MVPEKIIIAKNKDFAAWTPKVWKTYVFLIIRAIADSFSYKNIWIIVKNIRKSNWFPMWFLHNFCCGAMNLTFSTSFKLCFAETQIQQCFLLKFCCFTWPCAALSVALSLNLRKHAGWAGWGGGGGRGWGAEGGVRQAAKRDSKTRRQS